MRKKLITTILALTIGALSLGLAGCGASDSGNSNSGASNELAVEESVQATGFEVSYGALYNDDEELSTYVPVLVTSNPYAEAMMQVTGYNYTLVPVDDTNYEFTVVQTCGIEGDDTPMFMQRTWVYSGTYTVDGDVYTLALPTGLNFNQETAGQFAAESGEGGADMWGPNGISFDETFTNPEGFGGLGTGEGYLGIMESCKVTVDGSSIVSFEAAE